jgi:hypothetical protein
VSPSTTTLLYDGWIDAWGEIDHSGDPRSARIGCMTRRLADLSAAEQRLLAELRFVRAAQTVALRAIDRFISAPANAGE